MKVGVLKYHSLLLVLSVLLLPGVGLSQETAKQDTGKVTLSYHKPDEAIMPDSARSKRETSLTDIGDDRGLYILAPKQKMQLRILGSVRFSALFDDVELPSKNTFNTFEIPSGAKNIKNTNYYNTLSLSRLGFEVTRKTKVGDIFIRLETDFAGPNNTFRIRHAYGEINHLLFGQTYSLFSNVAAMPATVDINGPTGSVSLRTPQIRYTGNLTSKAKGYLALEYSLPDLAYVDSVNISSVQKLPDLTGRIDYKVKWGIFQLSGIATVISMKDSTDVTNSMGVGGSVSGKFFLSPDDALLWQGTCGRAISHYISIFDGKEQDMIYNPGTRKYQALFSVGGFLSYQREWLPTLSTFVSFGIAAIANKNYQPDEAFNHSYSASIDVFWEAIEGARLGFEYVLGSRIDKGGSTGYANRIWFLVYYDF